MLILTRRREKINALREDERKAKKVKYCEIKRKKKKEKKERRVREG